LTGTEGAPPSPTEIPQAAPINAVAFLPNGKAVATGDWDGWVRFHYFDAGNPVLALRYPERIYALAISPDGSTLAVAGAARTIQVYELPTGKLKTTLDAHDHAVESLDFSPDGKRLASAGGSNVRLWDTATWKPTGRQIRLAPEILCVKFSRDGKLLAISDGDGTVPHYENMPSTVILLDIATQAEVRRLKGHTNSIYALAFSPDGKILASGSMDQTVKLWDVGTGELRETIVPGVSEGGSATEAGAEKTDVSGANRIPLLPGGARP
jgi:WD40 repeat protein